MNDPVVVSDEEYEKFTQLKPRVVTADIEVDDLLKVILLLVIVWLALEVVDPALGVLFGPLKLLLGFLVLALLVAWFVDAI